MADIPIFNGTWPPVPNTTAFGYFDTEQEFLDDAPKVGKSIVYKLGFPIISIELQASQIYSCFEDAIMTYSSEVNKYNIKENLLNLQGSSTETNLTHKVITPNLGSLINMSKEYGSEAGSGGDIDWKRGYITTTPNQQKYDVDALWRDEFEEGLNIEIKNVFHNELPASATYYGGTDGNGVEGEFGWDYMGYGVNYLLYPISSDLQRMQHIEFNDRIRKSAYSFFIRNNVVEIFPVPDCTTRIWFEYVVVEERNNPLKLYPSGSITSGSIDSESTLTSDFSNAPYDLMKYTNINSPGKSWIREYAFALVKEMLGGVRGKFSEIIAPDSSISMDGDSLRSEGQTMREQLLEQLREMLESSSRRIQMESKEAESEHLMNVMSKAPSLIFIG